MKEVKTAASVYPQHFNIQTHKIFLQNKEEAEIYNIDKVNTKIMYIKYFIFFKNKLQT
jgi:hypothetical protein